MVNNQSFAVSYMEAFGGGFYMLPGTNPWNLFGQNRVDVQVPGAQYPTARPIRTSSRRWRAMW